MRRARWAAVTVVALLLSGCAAIPTSGVVEPGTTEGPNDTTIVYLPNPPAAGAKPSEIVAGFLTAAASAKDDFQVAREYLASSFSRKWRPRTQVLVQAAQPTITSTSDSDLRAEVPISSAVDGSGIFSQTSSTARLSFHVVRESGQWRIDKAPDGIVLSQPVFQQKYAPTALQFFDRSWSRLVPDLRWFPVPSGAGTSVVDALVAGPRGPLANGIAVNALAGTKVGSVTTSDDVTTVVLDTGGRSPTSEVAGRMQQQLAESLQLRSPSALRLIVNGQVAAQVKALPSQAVSLNPYVVEGNRFGTLAANGALTEDRTLGARVAGLRPRAMTVSAGQQIAAVQTASGDVAVVTPAGYRIVDTRSGLIAPTLDQSGWVYSVPGDDPGALVASDSKGEAKNLVVDLAGSSILAIEASPDGTRMLVLVSRASGPQAFVAGIERNADGTPTGLTDERSTVSLGGAGTGIDASWVDDSSVAVLTSGTTDRVTVQPLGGLSRELGPLTGATTIVGVPSETYLRVRLQSGDIWRWTGSLWQSEGTNPVDVSVLAVQR